MNIIEQVDYLMQGTEYGDEQLKKAMSDELEERLKEAEKEKRPLRVYCGFDPSTSDLHLGHTVPIRKLRQFQELGHTVIFLVGNFTSLIGDPSDKDELRPSLSVEEVEENSKSYARQAFKILDSEKTLIEYNAKWLSDLNFEKLIKAASQFTISEFMNRDNFKKRYDKGEEIYLHETLYAFLQGYDAFSLDADVQVGGTDQFFNIVIASRRIMTVLGKKPNVALIMGILPGTNGKTKMSKSLGNHIPLLAQHEDMYGMIMNIPDDTMGSYMRLLTRWTPDEISRMEQRVKEGSLSVRSLKMKLAYEIVSIYYYESMADRAQYTYKRGLSEESF